MRIVSLVPSLTETLHEFGVGGSVVGVTRFCVRPDTARETAAVVGGTKDPDVPRILQLRPDLVVADEDENKREHVASLRAAGIHVHVTRIATVSDVAHEVRTLGKLIGRAHEAEKAAADLQEEAQRLQAATSLLPAVPCFVPIWKKPLMTIGGHTYMSDLLRIAGGRNVFHEVDKKYFEADLDEVRDRRPDAALLPTEPYRFRQADRAWISERIEVPVEATRIVDGEAFTWFGVRSLEGLRVLTEAVAEVRAAASDALRPT